ncbi:WhiB family transcriptional regulator [Lentzea jiangxiensis]|uniref:Transcriptional regulator WhiB n=1 Tax=Lentzea jiangxiensis TaxID=641025 RepID=A0A1H0X4K3_9PSEU|nr:WhiB family transcriptional regulator [Lentzea jiangxiensis]SDP97830.1 Transcription factor WhiB [Lentzea jiangxiensis]
MREPTVFHYVRLAEARRFAEHSWQELDAVIRTADGLRCRSSNPDVFFPEEGSRFAGRQAMRDERARVAELCRGCPVRTECLASALQRGEAYGSWGGICQPDYQILRQLWSERVHAAAPPPAGSTAVKETR